MTEVAILIPVLGRPHRVAPLLDSLEASRRFVDLFPVFLVSPGDYDEILAIETERQRRLRWDDDDPEGLFPLVVDWEPGLGDYQRKINRGAQRAATDFEWLFLAADDLAFRPGWIERALACHLETGACVIGTNDLGNGAVVAGQHSTHTLVHRDYLGCGTADEPDSRKLLHEGYDHTCCDVEFVETAQARETWAHAGDSIVEHLHPLWRKADLDATYEKGRAHIPADRQLLSNRRRLWAAT